MHSDNSTLCISTQIHIKVTYVIPEEKKNAIHLTETKSGNVGTRARKQDVGGKRKGIEKA